MKRLREILAAVNVTLLIIVASALVCIELALVVEHLSVACAAP